MAKGLIDRALRLGEARQFKEYERRVAAINRVEPEMELLAEAEIRKEADQLRERARNGEPVDDLLPEAFALCREAARRSIGQRHFDVQLIGGMVLHDGAIAEMKTGEGKTLTATLAVFLNSLDGTPVHLVTVNDYLARRDAEWMGPIYEALGVSVGVIQSQDDPALRQRAYACDVVYGTNSEFGFDYLRDNMAASLEHCVQREHNYAIVDEVDNILIDEARTPLIISGAPEAAADLYYTFARLAKQLTGVPAKEKLKSLGEDKDTTGADYDYEYDEKHKTVAPTEPGVAKAERFLGVDNLYVSEHGTLVNHLIQSLKAQSLFHRDDDYAVIDGEVKIVDEFTGRILEGRRWSEGLHQAIEAKEGVPIREENQTLATITLQNYFRLYDKLAGMTGTALTEAQEFMKIYEMPVVDIPTNEPMVRDDHNDQIYKTKGGKWKAVASEIAERHKAGQPILVGTISVEVSEMLSGELTRQGIDHVVLNAKPEHAQREGETIAQAGRVGAVTIATNMAGRGVDIKLGGDPDQMARAELRKLGVSPDDESYEQELAELRPRLEEQCEADGEKVIEAGGLFICGTERHESRRIDNQLRGRSGRQGDPGESRFYLSAEDELIRLFAGDRIYRILDRLGPVDEHGEEYPLEAKMLSRTVENAQKKVEQQNFLIRKRVLEYDDVMNEQRRVIYKYRREILEGRDMSDVSREEIGEVVTRLVEEYTPGDVFEDWDLGGLQTQAAQLWPLGADLGQVDASQLGSRGDRPHPGRGRPGGLRAPRAGAGRRADALPGAPDPASDHRPSVARAPLRDGLPARGHPPARLRPDRSPGRVQERGLQHVRGSDELDLGRVRADHLPRGGERRAGGFRARARVAAAGAPVRRRWAGAAVGPPAGGGIGRRRSDRGRRRGRSSRAGGRWSWGRAASRGEPGDGGQVRPRQDRPQRSLLVRLGQEVQEVPRGLSGAAGA